MESLNLLSWTKWRIDIEVGMQGSQEALEYVEKSTSLCLTISFFGPAVSHSPAPGGLAAHIPFCQPSCELLRCEKEKKGRW